MDAEVEPVNPAEAEWVARQRRWTQGWLRFVLPAVFLVYLLYVAQAVGNYNDGTAAVWGYLILVAFAACYLAFVREGPATSGHAILDPVRHLRSRCSWRRCRSPTRQRS